MVIEISSWGGVNEHFGVPKIICLYICLVFCCIWREHNGERIRKLYEHGYWNLFMRGGQRNVLRVRIYLPIRLSWFWYRCKKEVHAVILSYSTSKSIDGARRYPRFMLKLWDFLVALHRVPLCSLPSPSWRDFNNHVHVTVYFFNERVSSQNVVKMKFNYRTPSAPLVC